MAPVSVLQLHDLCISPQSSTGEYSKCCKVSNTFLVLFSNKMLISRAGIHKMLVRIANRKDPDQTASESLILICTLSWPFLAGS